MKRFVLLLSVIVILVAGVLFWQRTRLSRLQGEMSAALTTVETTYGSLVEERVAPLEGRADLTAEQRRLIARIRDAVAAVNAAGDDAMELRMQSVTDLQQLLRSFVGSVPAEQALAQEPAFGALAQAIGERGAVRSSLSAFNDLAIRWNAAVRGLAGSLLERVGIGDTARLVPFLRFDGTAEFVPQINL